MINRAYSHAILQVIYTRLKRSQSVLSSLSSSVAAAASVAAVTATTEQLEMKQSASTNTDFSVMYDDDDNEAEEDIRDRESWLDN